MARITTATKFLFVGIVFLIVATALMVHHQRKQHPRNHKNFGSLLIKVEEEAVQSGDQEPEVSAENKIVDPLQQTESEFEPASVMLGRNYESTEPIQTEFFGTETTESMDGGYTSTEFATWDEYPTLSPTLSPTQSPTKYPTQFPTTEYPVYTDTVNALYQPGNITVFENGLRLSKGLRSRIIARTGERVPLYNGRYSREEFHKEPDGAATFAHPSGKGWVYVSNSEVPNKKGGVGAVEFDEYGNVIGYRMILEGTSLNCSGGKTPWNTWISCEENWKWGQIYEVDPFGEKRARKTVMGGDGGNYESVAVDNRDPYNPKFFVTNDLVRGEIRRFTPDPDVVEKAINDENYWPILSKKGQGVIEYLVLSPKTRDGRRGTFRWSSSLEKGKASAEAYYPETEGIDFKDGLLYFAAKLQKEVLVLDLDQETFTKFSTRTNKFRGEPDQVLFIRGGEENVMYFTEEREDDTLAGIHARDGAGNYFTVLESEETSYYSEETNGLALSPDNMHMYVAVQRPGILYEVTREDGLPFNARTLDIRHHSSAY